MFGECEQILVCSVLENTIDQLAIVCKTMSYDEDWIKTKHNNEMEEPLERLFLQEYQLFQKKIKRAHIESGLLDNTPEVRYESIRKIYTEARYFQSVLENVTEELRETGNCVLVNEPLRRFQEREEELKQISLRAKSVRNDITDLRSQIDKAKDKSNVVMLTESTKIAQLKDHLLDVRKICRIEENFMKQLFIQKQEQYIKIRWNTEKELNSTREKLRKESEYEKSITTEVESCLRNRHAYLTDLHTGWRKRLFRDVQSKDEELESLLKARASDQNYFQIAKKRYQELTKFVEDYKKERERLRIEKETLEKELSAIIRIQSWWRMTMVRNCLGPYRKKKKRAQDDQTSSRKGKRS